MNNFIYLDLDGVLADFDKYVEDERAKIIPTPVDTRKWRFGSNLCRKEKGFFEKLEVFDGAKDFVSELEKLYPGQIRILSAAVTERQDSSSEKARWVEKHFPSLKDKVILCRSKEAVGSIGDILIDDHPTWNGSDKFRGIVLKFETSNVPKEYDVILNKIKSHFSKEK